MSFPFWMDKPWERKIYFEIQQLRRDLGVLVWKMQPTNVKSYQKDGKLC